MNNILYPTLDEVLKTHYDVINMSGGLSINGYSTDQEGKINSILDHMQNDIYYPTFIHKLRHLVYSLIKNHIFLDGNKRASIIVSSYFLALNGYSSQDLQNKYMVYMENIVVQVAENFINKDELYTILFELVMNI